MHVWQSGWTIRWWLSECWLFKDNTNHQVPLLTKMNYLSHSFTHVIITPFRCLFVFCFLRNTKSTYLFLSDSNAGLFTSRRLHKPAAQMVLYCLKAHFSMCYVISFMLTTCEQKVAAPPQDAKRSLARILASLSLASVSIRSFSCRTSKHWQPC